MFSDLSEGIKNAPKKYNQVARTIACMAEVIRCSGREPADIGNLSFYIVAPESRKENFDEFIDRKVIKNQVKCRFNNYTNANKNNNYVLPKTDWYKEWFTPTLKAIKIKTIYWEDIISFITCKDDAFGRDLNAFYQRCLCYNRQTKKGRKPTSPSPRNSKSG